MTCIAEEAGHNAAPNSIHIATAGLDWHLEAPTLPFMRRDLMERDAPHVLGQLISNLARAHQALEVEKVFVAPEMNVILDHFRVLTNVATHHFGECPFSSKARYTLRYVIRSPSTHENNSLARAQALRLLGRLRKMLCT